MKRLEGRSALITGASRGIGRAIAERFAMEGAKLVLVARSIDGLAAAKDTCRSAGAPMVVCFGTDVSDTSAVTEMVTSAVKELGGLDIVVNNAGVTRDNILMRLKDEDWDTVLDTNLKAAFAVTRAAARPLMKSSHGRIISIASVIGITGNSGQANYAASKGGLIAFTKSMAKELASRGVTANVIAPGMIDTDMTAVLSDETRAAILANIPLARLGKPDDIAACAAFLASDEAAYITGQVLVVDGGMVI